VGQLIGLAFDPESGNVFAYPRGSLNIVSFTPTGTQVGVIQHPGIFSSDFDMDFTPEAVNVGGIFVPAGTLLAVNGDDSPDQLYALDKTTGTILASVALASPQGDQEQVGIAYHAGRHTVFVVDDVTDQIREIDPSTGAQLNRFPVQPAGSPAFGEVFGDLEVDSATGNLLVASSQQNVIRVLTPTGAFVTDVRHGRSGSRRPNRQPLHLDHFGRRAAGRTPWLRQYRQRGHRRRQHLHAQQRRNEHRRLGRCRDRHTSVFRHDCKLPAR
jgi:hypothetical protein